MYLLIEPHLFSGGSKNWGGIMEDFIHDRYGWCYFSIDVEDRAIIFNLYVEPEHRKQGHATRYLKYVINRIREYGFHDEISIQADPKDKSINKTVLIEFYQRMGLKVI